MIKQTEHKITGSDVIKTLSILSRMPPVPLGIGVTGFSSLMLWYIENRKESAMSIARIMSVLTGLTIDYIAVHVTPSELLGLIDQVDRDCPELNRILAVFYAAKTKTN